MKAFPFANMQLPCLPVADRLAQKAQFCSSWQEFLQVSFSLLLPVTPTATVPWQLNPSPTSLPLPTFIIIVL